MGRPIAIARPINGISLNGLEFLMDGDKYKQFEDKAAAYALIRETMSPDFTDEEIEDHFVFVKLDESGETIN